MSYSEDIVDAFAERLLGELAGTGWEYEARPLRLRRGVRVRVSRPFRAEIVVREWVHRARLPLGRTQVPVRVGAGTVIEVSPGPRLAPEELRRFMARLLAGLRLDREAAQWSGSET